MSRIGKKPISIPAGVTIETANNIIKVKGPKGTLEQPISGGITATIEEGTITFSRPSDQKDHRALHGLYRALVNNMIVGVTSGYKIDLDVVGVGFKAAANGQILEMALGYSHSVYLEVPKEIKVGAVTEKGKDPRITLECIDKQLLGQVAAKIKSLRPVEPYKGKGIRIVGEFVRRKAGKSGGKGK